MSAPALVSIEFSYNGQVVNNIIIDNPTLVDVNTVSEESRASNTRFEYSGRHDHGDLPKLKNSGPAAVLVSALQEAKRECDKYLTQRINEEYGYESTEKTSVMEVEEGEGDVGVEVEEEITENKAKKMCLEKS